MIDRWGYQFENVLSVIGFNLIKTKIMNKDRLIDML